MEHSGELTGGDVRKKLLRFAAPIIISSLIQAVYGLVDMVTIGYFVGPAGMSAVSMGAQITNVVLVIIEGLSNGGTVAAGQLSGRGAQRELPKLMGTMLSFFILLALLLTAVLMAFARPLLSAINTPPEAFSQAVSYLLICAGGTVFVYVYNSMAAVLRGTGDSAAPMRVVIVTVVLNAALDLLLICVLKLGVIGAALATVICQIISVLLLAGYIRRKTELFDFRPASFRIDRGYLALTVKIGLPQAIQFVFASSSFVLMSGLVNVFGVEASAAAGAAAKIQLVANLPSQGMMAGLMALTAQNLAAAQPERVKRGMLTGMVFVTVINLLIFVLCMLAPRALFRIFTPEDAVIAVGVGYLRRMAFSFVLEGFMFCLCGVIAGAGYTPLTMCCGILSAFAVRYAVAWLLCRVLALGFNGIGLAYLAGPIVSSLIAGGFMLTGRWKTARFPSDAPAR